MEFEEVQPTITPGAAVDTIPYQGIGGRVNLSAEPSPPAPRDATLDFGGRDFIANDTIDSGYAKLRVGLGSGF